MENNPAINTKMLRLRKKLTYLSDKIIKEKNNEKMESIHTEHNTSNESS